MNGSNASKMAGLSIADDVQRIETMTKTAEWARKLGVTDGGRFRSLLQLGGSARTAQRVAGIVERGGETGYRVGRHAIAIGQKYGSYASVGIVGGSAVGMTGKQMQPMWDYVKNRKEIQAQEREQHQIADTEAAELERLYAEQHGGAAPQPTPGVDAGAATGAGASSTEPQVVGTSPSGSQMVYFPEEGVVVDQGNGDIYDPNTQQVIGNLVQQQGGQAATPAPAPAPAASAPAASAPAATTGGGEQQVYVDPQTGYYVDPQTGMMADPASGQVYDTQGNVVGNVNAAA
jgi:hypothetical protein